MKKMILSLIAMLAIAAQANAMSYEQARNEALFLTDKMAYELNLNDAQYEAAYEINLDYLMGVTSHTDVFGPYWDRRNADIRFILYSWQWDAFCAATYFYRPLYWSAGYWHFGIYARYPYRDYYYFGRPRFYVTYRGGHSWRMNGGRSYYEHRHNYYRPHVDRHRYSGMRNSWDRGDYRHHNNDSHNGRNRNDGYDRGNHNSDRHDNGTHNRDRHDNGTPNRISSPASGHNNNVGNRTASTVSSTRTTANRSSMSTSANRSAVSTHSASGNRSAVSSRPSGGNRSAVSTRPSGGNRSAGGSRSGGGGNRSGGGRR